MLDGQLVLAVAGHADVAQLYWALVVSGAVDFLVPGAPMLEGRRLVDVRRGAVVDVGAAAVVRVVVVVVAGAWTGAAGLVPEGLELVDLVGLGDLLVGGLAQVVDRPVRTAVD